MNADLLNVPRLAAGLDDGERGKAQAVEPVNTLLNCTKEIVSFDLMLTSGIVLGPSKLW